MVWKRCGVEGAGHHYPERVVRPLEFSYKTLADPTDVASNADQDDFVEAFCLALFEHDLPALYKAKFYAYLSTHPGMRALHPTSRPAPMLTLLPAPLDYDETSYLHVAENWIQTAKEQSAALGWIPDEVEQWAEIIDKQKAEPADLSLEGLTLGGMDGTLDGAGDAPGRVHGKGKAPAHVHDVDNCKMCQRMKYGDDAALLERVPATVGHSSCYNTLTAVFDI